MAAGLIVLIQGANFMTWVEEDVSAIKRMVENQQHVMNVTLANNSSLLCNSVTCLSPVHQLEIPHLCPQLCHFVIPLVIIHRLIVWLKYHADLHNLNDSLCLISHLPPAVV